MNKYKKAQSEAVGFVVIILMVIIVSVIFLGIRLRQGSSEVITEDAAISNFLGASFSYKTSDSCYKGSEPYYRSLEDLVKDCYQQSGGGSSDIICPNSRKPCEALNNTYGNMLLRFAPAGTVNYYSLAFIYNSSTDERTFYEISGGDKPLCQSKRAGRNYVSLGSGEVAFAELEICYAA